MQQLRELLATYWKSLVLYGGLFAVLAAALFWKLGSLVPGYAEAEQQTFNHSLAIGDLLDNPLNAPFLMLTRALAFVLPNNLLATRLAATVFGLVLLGLFCWLVRQWHGRRTAIIGTLLFGLSAWFLHTARLGTPEILLTGVFVLTACGFWLAEHKSWLALLVCFALAALFLYVPGMLWFIAVGIVWQWKTIDHIFKNHLGIVSVGAVLLLLLLAPLGWSLYKHTDLIMPWLGLPEQWPNVMEVLRNILAVPYHLTAANATQPLTWLGRAPILDVFSIAALIIGGYVYVRRASLVRTRLFASLLIVGAILTALAGPATLSTIMPFIYVLIAAGTGYLLDIWMSVFPRNPIARGTGLTLMGLIIGLVCAYHLTHYFIGWPEAKATHDTYHIRQ